MKKILLTALIASAATITFAEVKSTTFALSSSSTWGVSDPEDGDGVELVGSTKTTTSITSDDITLKVEKGTANYARLWNTKGVITFRPYNGNILTFSATGFNITKITFDANGGASKCLLTTTEGTFTYPDWTGSASSVAFNATGTSQLLTATVTYETAEGGNGGTVGEIEKYTAISWDGTAYTVSDEFKAVVQDPATGGVANNAENGKSIVKFGTSSIEATAVGGSNPKDVTETEAGVFPGWAEWNEVKWDYKNQNDILFAYIGGTGNPYVEIGQEAVVTEGAATGIWRPSYVYFGPNEEVVGGKSYRKALPVNGVLYKFFTKADGLLLMSIWSNKGNHNTYVINESTMDLIPFRCEGYINGQNYNKDNGDPAELDGKKKWLSSDEIKNIHDAAKCEKDAEGNIIPDTDSAPYVIGAGNQPFWGKIVFEVKKDQTYWVFQASTQIGFQGFEFTPNGKDDGGSLNGISQTKVIRNAVVFDILGNRVTKMQSGRIYIQNGKKVIVR